jgi:hypothetical protein
MSRPWLWLASLLQLLATVVNPAAGSQLTLTWAGSGDAKGYSVERQAPAGSFGEIGTVMADVAMYVDSTVLSGVTYCYRVRAFNDAGYSGYSNVSCGTPAASSASTFTDDFNRPDSTELGNGWIEVAGALEIRAGQVQNAPETTTHMAVQTGLMGANQTVSASFAPEGDRSGVRFGVLVRYVDSNNYYLCYRRAAGSHFVRISKVINGVEKILKTAHVPRPAKGRFFALGCSAEGSTLTLTLDGATKLTASDSMLSSGGVGFMIGYMMGQIRPTFSNLADDFVATLE